MIFAWDVPSSVTFPECALLAALADGKDVLEVGCWLGRSTIALASTARHVTAVDWHHGDFYAGEQETEADFRANLERYGIKNVTVVVSRIEDAMQEPQSFDGVFIDAAHDDDSVRRHWMIASQAVKPGGWVAFHDYGRFGVTPVLHDVGQDWEWVESLAWTVMR